MTSDQQPTPTDLIARAWAARRESRYDDARADLETAITMLRAAGDLRQLSNALGKLAHVEMDHERWDAAFALYEEAVQVSENAGDVCGAAHKTFHLGDVNRNRNRRDEAAAYYRRALEMYRTQDDPPPGDLANALCRAASVEDNTARAIDLWSEARAIYEAAGVQPGIDECAKQIADLSE